MVKRSRSQSREAPSARCCTAMRLPDCSFHAQTRFKNSSRPRSWRDLPSFCRISRSTTICVAMPAWSMPGIQQTLKPLMRLKRTTASSMVAVSAWPMCSAPVTLGGGRTMEKGGFSLTSCERKKPFSSHHFAQRGSTLAGS